MTLRKTKKKINRHYGGNNDTNYDAYGGQPNGTQPPSVPQDRTSSLPQMARTPSATFYHQITTTTTAIIPEPAAETKLDTNASTKQTVKIQDFRDIPYDPQKPKLITPDDIKKWFDDSLNYYKYMYGSGKILLYQEKRFEDELNSLEAAIQKTNESYEEGARATVKILAPGSSDIALMKKELNKTVEETINESYKTEYFELIQKKIRYYTALESIRDRRSYLLYLLNAGEAGKKIIVDNILYYAMDMYSYYRGPRYTELRAIFYDMIFLIANVPEVFTNSLALNSSITGPAGSGKTTLARKMANWYNAINVLTGDSFMTGNDKLTFIETDRSGLIAQYLGQTAPKTLGVLYNSLEKTLFIDEAYAVPGCSFSKDPNKPDEDSYGSEFVATLLPFMANHKGLYAILIAGYKNLIDLCFFSRNEGLPRRFPLRIDLPLYSTDELYFIMLNNIINKRKNLFAENKTKENEFKLYRQSYYLCMKALMMMIHFDTSTDNPFDLLRKYILLFDIMDRQYSYYRDQIPSDKDDIKKLFEFPKITQIYSHTILIHILICCLPGSVRRNMMRIEFFNTVYGYDTPNLSYFPAQAGEMELLADKCINKIEPLIDLFKGKAGNPISIPLSFVFDLYNSYLVPKNVNLAQVEEGTKESGTGKFYFELIKSGFDNKQFINDKLKTFLLNDIFNDKEKFPNGIPSLVDLFVYQQNEKNREELIEKVNTIFNDENYFSLIGADGKLLKYSMFEKIYNKIKKLPETEFPVNIERDKLEVEYVRSNIEIYPVVETLQSKDIDGAWADLGRIIEYTPPSNSANTKPLTVQPTLLPPTTTTGGTVLNTNYNNLRIRQLQYGRRTRRKLNN
jgi:hypothetical protein